VNSSLNSTTNLIGTFLLFEIVYLELGGLVDGPLVNVVLSARNGDCYLGLYFVQSRSADGVVLAADVGAHLDNLIYIA
jgi:hypothetical protein